MTDTTDQASSAELQAAKSRLESPVGFCESALGVTPWSKQKEILEAIWTHKRVSVKSANSTGKTFIGANAVLAWLLMYPDGIVATTAPTFRQVRLQIWGEVRALLAKAWARGDLLDLKDKINVTDLHIGPKNFAIGISPDDESSFSGFHEGKVLLILDEAQGIRSQVWDAIEGLEAGGDVHVLALGNPLVPGRFKDTFERDRDRWHNITISAFDTPNLQGWTVERLQNATKAELADNPWPKLTRRDWVHDKIKKWRDTGSWRWDAQIMGEFPQAAQGSLIPSDKLELGKRDVPESGRVIVGIDVATGHGEDHTVLWARRGGQHIKHVVYQDREPRGPIARTLTELGGPGAIALVTIDADGPGEFFALHIKDLGYKVKLFHAGSREGVPSMFRNLKAEKYYRLGERYKSGVIGGVTDAETINQLRAMIIGELPNGQMAMQEKDELKKVIGRSPDDAEALMLCNAYDMETSGMAKLTVEDGQNDEEGLWDMKL